MQSLILSTLSILAIYLTYNLRVGLNFKEAL